MHYDLIASLDLELLFRGHQSEFGKCLYQVLIYSGKAISDIFTYKNSDDIFIVG